jgi:putative heme-binding domain-containing protein
MALLAALVFGLTLQCAGPLVGQPKPVLKRKSTGAARQDETTPRIRQAWTDSRITGSPEPAPPFRVERVFTKLAFHQPVDMRPMPHDNRLCVVEQTGKIYSFRNEPGVEQPALLLDLAADFAKLVAHPGAKGISSAYGLIFHPDFAKNRECFVTYGLASKSGTPLKDGGRLSRFKVTATNPPRCDPASEEVILTWLEGGHMGSALAFGRDGMLYVSTGDAGPAAPPDEMQTGQGVNDLLSCVLRLDVDHRDGDRPYRVPADNPFLSIPGARGEIWAYGFRNPWKMSFDRATGDLWVGDVGWELWELIYHVERGGNYGWSIMEGPQTVHSDRPIGPTPIRPPADALPHSIAASITGGYVYRGKRFPELVGHYFYGDWETRRIWAARVETTTDADGKRAVKLAPRRELTDPAVRLITFCEDEDGELYLVDYDLGTIHRFERNATPDHSRDFPRKLSQTGLFTSLAPCRPAAGVYPFSVIAEQWADGATAKRLVAVPGDAAIALHRDPVSTPGSMFNRVLDVPKDTVLAKTLSLEMTSDDPASQKPIETQILHFDGRDFRAYTYRWNDEASDATLVPADGDERKLTVVDPAAPGGKRTLRWNFASRVQCLQCHNPWAGYTLGFSALQLNRPSDDGGATRNQLEALRELGVFVPAGEKRPGDRPDRDWFLNGPHLVDPRDDSADLTARARSYLHANCGHCHRFGGGGSAKLELRFDLPIDQSQVIDQPPTQGAFGIRDAAIVKPGDPYHSVLYYRMAKTGTGRMPRLASEWVDEQGLALIREWIRQMQTRRDGDSTLPAFGAMKSAERREAISRALSATSSALALSTAAADKRLPPEIASEVVSAGAAHNNTAIRDLFERFLPDQQRAGRIGARVNPREILSLTGDRQRGKQLVVDTATLQCKTCHRIGADGGKVGPELTTVGKKLTRDQLLESLAEPSKTIAEEYRSQSVATSDGRAFTGIVVRRTSDEVVLRDAQDKETRLATADIEQIQPQPQSLMPEGLLRDLTPQQAADLVEYLHSLR